ncbi:uncharacterized protein BJ171DRAFT_429764 [Polychytrium aggregatum]|uniref:uncharacterized protein n=1 Tax=Polychytrium aggregatum TaxID=110093 RepID=UPI0022FF0155|nr:uncharacterized protein BJ171DRAFT_429764 [Polychytrium aggregatum]KAI9193459.1 hypothetical protein BJ171DRAFT_429764 [Polychytrium aggregatum]
MTTKEEIELWDKGIKAYEKGDFNGALGAFKEIGDYSRISFNIAMVYSQLGDHYTSSMMYTRAIAADPFFAIAFFQRAYSSFAKQDYEYAISDYDEALKLLRDNDNIDYAQVGLKYKLYRCEIHFNRAMCFEMLGDSKEASRDIESARLVVRTSEHKNIIERAARVGLQEITIFTVPHETLFTVSESKMKNLKKKQYLDGAKVVVARDNDDTFTGFSGAAITSPGPQRTKTTEAYDYLNGNRRFEDMDDISKFPTSSLPRKTTFDGPTPIPPGPRHKASNPGLPRAGTFRDEALPIPLRLNSDSSDEYQDPGRSYPSPPMNTRHTPRLSSLSRPVIPRSNTENSIQGSIFGRDQEDSIAPSASLSNSGYTKSKLGKVRDSC